MIWIDINERLPLDGQEVYLWIPNEIVGKKLVAWTWEGQDTKAIRINNHIVTHWMVIRKPETQNDDSMKPKYCIVPLSYDGFLPIEVNGKKYYDSTDEAEIQIKKLLDEAKGSWQYAIIPIYSR